MATELRLLKLILDIMFMVLLESNFSPSMKESLMEKRHKFKEILLDHGLNH